VVYPRSGSEPIVVVTYAFVRIATFIGLLCWPADTLRPMLSDSCIRTVAALMVCAVGYSSSAFGVEAAEHPLCQDIALAQHLSRAREAPTGSEFVRQIQGLSDDEREAAILEQASSGNFPTFLRHAEPVTLTGRFADGAPVAITVCVAPDYLAVGSDTDYLFVPMRLQTALAVATRYDSLLPTRRIVDAIYAQARVHLQPQPLPASDTMRTTGYYWHHSELVREQRQSFAEPPGALTAGDKKDLVLTNRFWTNRERVAIYGWHRADGRPIQPLSTVHGARYADYSHGVRLVAAVAYLNGVATPLLKLLQDPRLASVLSDEGALRNAGELLHILGSLPLSSAGCGARPGGICLPAHQVEEVPVVGKTQESWRELAAPLPVDFTHPFDQVLHQ